LYIPIVPVAVRYLTILIEPVPPDAEVVLKTGFMVVLHCALAFVPSPRPPINKARTMSFNMRLLLFKKESEFSK